MKYLLCVFILIGCTQNVHLKPNVINAEFEKYYDKIGEHYGVPILIPIDFRNLQGNKAGQCTYNTKLGGHISIDPYVWEGLSEKEREALILHELGHCLFLRFNHITEFFEDNCPTSVLYPTIVPNSCFAKHKDHYYQELGGF